MKRKNHRLFGFLLAAVALTTSRSSDAYSCWVCSANQRVMKWPGGLRMYAVQASFLPGTGTVQYDAYLHAAWNWNQIYPLMDYFWTWPWDWQHYDGYSQTALVDPSVIAPNYGLTVPDYVCNDDEAHWTEQDVLLRYDMSFQWQDESFYGLDDPATAREKG